MNTWQVLQGQTNVGGRVVIADWRCDWVGLGLAELLVKQGRHVRLAVNGMVAGQNIPQYARDIWIGILHKLGVEIILLLFAILNPKVYVNDSEIKKFFC